MHENIERLRLEEGMEKETKTKIPVLVSFRTTFVFGFLFTSVLAIIVYLLLTYLFANMLIGSIGAVAICAYFGIEGLIEIPIAHKAVPLIFGERVSWFLLGEGKQWVPHFFMNAKVVDTRIHEKQVPLAKVLSKDNIPLSVSVSLAFRVNDPFLWTQVEEGEDLIGNLAERTVRWSASENAATELPSKTKDLSKELEKVLDEETAEWGIDITKAIVEGIDLPESIKQANEKKEVEKSEKDAETTELKHLSDRAKELKIDFPGLTDEQIFNIIQAERGKITRTVVDGTASGITKAAGLISRNNLKGGRG